MGCASSTQPLITAAGSEVVKAAKKTTTDAVQGVKQTVDSTMETTKDNVGNVVQNVKQELQLVVKENSEKIEDAKNALMEKLQFGQADTEHTQDTEDTENSDKDKAVSKETANLTDITTATETITITTTTTTTNTTITSELESQTLQHRNNDMLNGLNTLITETEGQQAVTNADNAQPDELEQLVEHLQQQPSTPITTTISRTSMRAIDSNQSLLEAGHSGQNTICNVQEQEEQEHDHELGEEGQQER